MNEVKSAPPDQATHSFLLHAGELLHRYGTPSYRFEAAMEKVSRSVGVNGTFLYTPTAIVASLEENRPWRFRRRAS